MATNILYQQKRWIIPNTPTIGYITGDGIGRDITPVTLTLLNAAIRKVYGTKRNINWTEILVGEKAVELGLPNLSSEALTLIRQFTFVLKGPLGTPVGKGFRSLNVAMRQELDLYACVRPVSWIPGVPAPVKQPEKLDVVIFRENTEDVYAGIEFKENTPDSLDLIAFLKQKNAGSIPQDAGIGIKPISKTASKRLVRAAIQYALDHGRTSVTLVHKGNIMKFTEGAFKEWGYEVAREEFADKVVLENELNPDHKIVLKDRIADAMFQQILLRPDEYDVIATTNLNGDYLSDACAAQVGGLGLAPGVNINYEQGIAVFEATHGTAPKHAGKDEANPGSLILSGALLLETMGWIEAAQCVLTALKKTIAQKIVTYDLARQVDEATEVKCSQFAQAIIKNMD